MVYEGCTFQMETVYYTVRYVLVSVDSPDIQILQATCMESFSTLPSSQSLIEYLPTRATKICTR